MVRRPPGRSPFQRCMPRIRHKPPSFLAGWLPSCTPLGHSLYATFVPHSETRVHNAAAAMGSPTDRPTDRPEAGITRGGGIIVAAVLTSQRASLEEEKNSVGSPISNDQHTIERSSTVEESTDSVPTCLDEAIECAFLSGVRKTSMSVRSLRGREERSGNVRMI